MMAQRKIHADREHELQRWERGMNIQALYVKCNKSLGKDPVLKSSVFMYPFVKDHL